MLSLTPLLSVAECDRVVDALERARPHWLRRSPQVEFFTVGAASYLDEPLEYLELARRLNPILRGEPEIVALHERVRACLAERLAAPVDFAHDLALPGFHVWRVPGIPTTLDDASLHFDLQYEKLPWPERARAGFARPISFTLPLRLPRQGSGLSLWDLSYERVNAFHRRTGYSVGLHDLVLLFERREQAYTPGELVLHSGHTLHRIAPTAELAPDDQRITLQGHGIYFDGGWKIYW